MKWKKLGHIFTPNAEHPWMLSHAANTVAENIEGDIFRIYFSTRDSERRSHIAFVDVDINPPFMVKGISERPILAPGEIGTFDDSGVSLSCIRHINGRKHLYYLGWNLGVTVPWRNSIGLAIWDESSQQFIRNSLAPMMDRDGTDPYSISYPFVLEQNGLFHMWYGSNLKWGTKQEEMAHLIKYASSENGIDWKRSGIHSLEFGGPDEYAMSRPYVIFQDGIFRMWYSFRGKAYQIGYAESADGIRFTRRDAEVGISASNKGWDSEMIEYPFIFNHKNRSYMLYNGNGYGRTGFGLAVAENS